MDGGSEPARIDGPHRTTGATVYSETLRIAVIAVVAIIVAKLVLPKIPGVGPQAASLL